MHLPFCGSEIFWPVCFEIFFKLEEILKENHQEALEFLLSSRNWRVFYPTCSHLPLFTLWGLRFDGLFPTEPSLAKARWIQYHTGCEGQYWNILTKMKGSSYNIFCKLNSLYVEIRRKITSQARANLTLRTQFFTPGSKITHPIGHAKCAPDRAWSRSNWKQCFRFLITQSRICGFQYYISIESFRN